MKKVANYVLKDGELTKCGVEGGLGAVEAIFDYDKYICDICCGSMRAEVELKNVCIDVHVDDDEMERKVLKFYIDSNEETYMCIEECEFNFQALYSGEYGRTDVAIMRVPHTYANIKIICIKGAVAQ